MSGTGVTSHSSDRCHSLHPLAGGPPAFSKRREPPHSRLPLPVFPLRLPCPVVKATPGSRPAPLLRCPFLLYLTPVRLCWVPPTSTHLLSLRLSCGLRPLPCVFPPCQAFLKGPSPCASLALLLRGDLGFQNIGLPASLTLLPRPIWAPSLPAAVH